MTDKKEREDILALTIDYIDQTVTLKTKKGSIEFKFTEVEELNLGTSNAVIMHGAKGDVFSILFNRETGETKKILLIKNQEGKKDNDE